MAYDRWRRRDDRTSSNAENRGRTRFIMLVVDVADVERESAPVVIEAGYLSASSPGRRRRCFLRGIKGRREECPDDMLVAERV